MKLNRFAYTPKGTYGRLYLEGLDHPLYTVEQVWDDNTPNKSCIPIGIYELANYNSPTRGKVLLLSNNVALASGAANGKARTYIEIHPANWAHELRGCIAPGMHLNDSWGVASSRKAMDLVLKHFNHGEYLEIVNATHGGTV